MPVVTSIHITHDTEAKSTIDSELLREAGSPCEEATALANFVTAAAGGARNARIEVQTDATDPVAASGTATMATPQANDTLTIGGHVLTFVASGATAEQVNIGVDNATTAANLVSRINGHATLSQWVVASRSGAVVTIAARLRGAMGNAITLASSNGTRLAVSGARLASGAGLTGTFRSYSFGR